MESDLDYHDLPESYCKNRAAQKEALLWVLSNITMDEVDPANRRHIHALFTLLDTLGEVTSKEVEPIINSQS